MPYKESNDNPLPAGAQPPAIVRALEKLLRPLVKLLLTRGITYPVFSTWLKEIFVEVAEKEFTLPDKPQTDSRINLLTGIHRKDVKRLRAEPADSDSIPSNVSLGALLVAKWSGMDDYLDSTGHPMALPRQSNDNEPSFDQLVATVNKDIRSRVVLDEWLRLGIVHVDEKKFVHLNVEAFIPEKGIDELAYYFGRNLHDHIAAASHNLSDSAKKYMERSVYYDQLSQESVVELEKLSEQQGMQALQALNKRAMALQTIDSERSNAQQRINFGVYFYNSSTDEDIDSQ